MSFDQLDGGAATISYPPDERTPCAGLGIIGHSDSMQRVLAQIAEAGATRDGVLVSGESGTGRGLVARAIHACGGPADRPFVAVDCDGFPPSRADAVLFGIPDGPDSRSAHASRSSRCERVYPGSAVHSAAAGGTLYLTRVEELPDRVQARLARLLRDGEAFVGSAAKPQPVDIKPVAAVGPGFGEFVREGRVRHDLHRRLAATAIQLPSLRERREDIPALARYFLERASDLADMPPRMLHPAAVAVLAAMPWWGNARELKALVETLVVKSSGAEIDLDTVLAHVRLDDASSRVPALALGGNLREARARFEREYIAAILAQHRGRIPEAARALGIQRTNLYRKLRSLHLPREDGGKASRGRPSASGT